MTIFCVKVWNGTVKQFMDQHVAALGVDDAIDDALVLFNLEDTSRNWTRAKIYSVVPVFQFDAITQPLLDTLE